jgi:TetR/AcrR family transcriptional repressor of nem operon
LTPGNKKPYKPIKRQTGRSLFQGFWIMDLKDKIIHESLRLFSLKGFLSTSIQDILEAANTSKGGLYNHFKSKEDLFAAVLREARKVWRERNLFGLDETDKPVEKVKRLLENYRDRYLKDRENFPGGCIFVTLSVELDDQLPHLARELNDGFVHLKAMIRRLLDQGKESGEIRNDVDTAAVTEMIFGGMIGAAVSHGMEKSPVILDNCLNSLIGYLESLK